MVAGCRFNRQENPLGGSVKHFGCIDKLIKKPELVAFFNTLA